MKDFIIFSILFVALVIVQGLLGAILFFVILFPTLFIVFWLLD